MQCFHLVMYRVLSFLLTSNGPGVQVGFPGGSDGKEFAHNVGDPGSIPGSEDALDKGMATHSRILAWEIPWTDLPGKSHGQTSMVGYSPWHHKESDRTEQLTYFSGGYTLGMEATSLASLWCFLGRDRNCLDSKMGFILV